MAGAKRSRKKKPFIPEPTPRFIKWSAAVAAAILIGILVFDYTVGAKNLRAPEAAAQAEAHEKS